MYQQNIATSTVEFEPQFSVSWLQTYYQTVTFFLLMVPVHVFLKCLELMLLCFVLFSENFAEQ